ncbi:MAG: hypothetical protein IPM82_27980 [Saprospiraceae bacterium]|nr:hypothetical protein [Saprospiraceae bacterium]
MTQWGLYYFGKNNPGKAEQSLVKATEMDSTNADAWGNLNFFYTAIGRFDEAELTIKRRSPSIRRLPLAGTTSGWCISIPATTKRSMPLKKPLS